MLAEIILQYTPLGGGYGTGMLLAVLVIEVPRYLFLLFAALFHKVPTYENTKPKAPFTLILVGHNEGDTIARSLPDLREQTHWPEEIIVVSDGSTDQMKQMLHRLQRKGVVTQYHHLNMRGGKSSALNLALANARNEFVICLDADSEVDRDAFANLMGRLQDGDFAAVAGNIRLSNARASMLTELQDIEYQTRISAGKHGMDLIGQVCLISGAFGAFRVSALRDIGFYDPVSGEDLDLTLRLRQAGYKVGFARNAVCYTKAPTTFKALVKQRYRWDRDSFHLRMRLHRDAFFPGTAKFRWSELFHYLDFLFFDLIPALAVPVSFLVLWSMFDAHYWTLVATFMTVYAVLDTLVYLFGRLHEREAGLRQLIFIPAHILYQFFIMRMLRFVSHASEWIFASSKKDDFVPKKVREAYFNL